MLTDRELLLAPASPTPPPRVYFSPRALHRLAFWCIILNIAVAAVIGGLILRQYMWFQTEDMRFVSDIDNAFVQGTQTLRDGFLTRYTEQTPTSDGDYDFDYAPGRLMIATLWTRWVRNTVDGPTTDWQSARDWPRFYSAARQTGDQYRLVRPLLTVNTTGELISAIAMFLLVRQWTSGRPNPGVLYWPQQRPARSAILGLIAALFFWFNLALIWNAHCWPQWDSWLLPFFLWALVAASADYWFCAGLLIAAGAMFKAQILFGAPMFILWPLWRGKFTAIARWIIGVAIGTTLITSAWLLRTDDHLNIHALLWVMGVGVSMPLFWLALRGKSPWFIKIPLAVVGVILVMWPLVGMGRAWIGWTALILLCVGALFYFAPTRLMRYALPAAVAAALFACVPIFNGSMAWFGVGIAFGTHRYQMMTRGMDNNLAAILESQWHWSLMDPTVTIPAGHLANWLGGALTGADPRVPFTPGQPFDVPLKYLLFSIYMLSVVLCSMGAAIHSKRGSPRFLVAVVAPWIVFFAVLTQMHQRYLLWGATLSAATVALGPGFAFLHLLVTVIAWSQEAVEMMNHGGAQGDIYTLITGWNPGIGWALLLCAAIFVYVGITPDRRRRAI